MPTTRKSAKPDPLVATPAFSTCSKCSRRYSSGAHPDPAYQNQCGICRPRIEAAQLAEAVKAAQPRMDILIEQGLRTNTSRPPIEYASHTETETQEWDELR